MVKFIFHLLVVGGLTIVTQVGGVLYLLCFPAFIFINRKGFSWFKRVLVKSLFFVTLYFLFNVFIIPFIAPQFGRMPLPIHKPHIKPLTIWTCIFNRHYVRPELYKTVLEVGEDMGNKHPGIVLSYLDANFPFYDGFPLVPHLSHNDGKKLDVAFFYKGEATQKYLANEAPSLIGYGVYVDPEPGEQNMPKLCMEKGAWQYGVLEKIIPQQHKKDMLMDASLTKEMIELFARHHAIGKIFLEPHLKSRLQITSSKVRFHGCQAVRHDDHFHVQLK